MLSEIPTELLSKILSFLPLKDVLHLSCTSSNFHDASVLVYTRRRNQIRGQYSSNPSGSSLTFCEVQRLLLSNYGFTVGLWKIVSTLFGGLLEVKFDGYQLVGTRYFPPPDPFFKEQLLHEKIFTVNIDDEGKCECICFRGYNGPHSADIVQFDSDGFQLDCCSSEIHQHPGGFEPAYELWVKEELGCGFIQAEDLITKYNTLSQEVSVKCRPLHLPQSQESVVIQPGLFKGTYSYHGVELVMLTYDDEDGSAVFTKITGDINIPAGKVTFVADLNAPITDAQESTIEYDGDDDTGSPRLSASGLPLRRFRVPSSFYSWQPDDPPEFFEHKFSSKGQVAEVGDGDAQFVPGNGSYSMVTLLAMSGCPYHHLLCSNELLRLSIPSNCNLQIFTLQQLLCN